MPSAAIPQLVYLALAIAGAVGTWFFNLQMPDLGSFFTQVWATPLTCSLGVDLLVVVLSFYVLMTTEGRRLRMSPVLLVVLGILAWLVAIACALPLFLFFRERALLRGEPAR
ncbi:MAG: DUF2834 domain-containing protein [Nannocystaceae bacterium]|nr:DUF2834 domain-containing protein [Nannocystaceae bacterium]